MNAALDELLDRLGSTPDEVAESLATAGITGKLNEPCECAIARYIESQGFTNVAVMNDEAAFSRDCFIVRVDGEPSGFIGDAGPVADFIRQFDAGQYPHLIAGAA